METQPKSKCCAICGVEKPLSDFARRLDGHQARCRICHTEYMQEYRKANPLRSMLAHARQRAKRDGFPCTITIEDLELPSHCPVLGIPLAYAKGSCNDNSPTLDKIVPELGYVPDNIAIISHLANSIKRNATVEQLVAVAEWCESVGAK